MSMRPPADAGRVRRFMEFLGRYATREAAVYLTGGATAVLEGWRATTRDVDLRIEPEEAAGALGDIIVRAKGELQLNVEFASPVDFMPALPRFPVIDEPSFRARMERAFGPAG